MFDVNKHAIVALSTVGTSTTVVHDHPDFPVSSVNINFGVTLSDNSTEDATAVGVVEGYIGGWVALASFSLALAASADSRTATFQFASSHLVYADYRLRLSGTTGSHSSTTLFLAAA